MEQTEFIIQDGVLLKYRGNAARITLPKGIRTVGRAAFFEAKTLCEITLPEGVTLIDGVAFAYCTALTRINIPASVTCIASEAFYRCPALCEVHFADTDGWYHFSRYRDDDREKPIAPLTLADACEAARLLATALSCEDLVKRA